MIVNPVVKMRPHPAAHLIRKYLPSAQEVYEKLKITSKQKLSPLFVSGITLRSLTPFTWNKREGETVWFENIVVWL